MLWRNGEVPPARPGYRSAPGYSGSLGISDRDVVTVAGTGAVLVAAAVLLHGRLVTVSLDRETARANGLPVVALDLAAGGLIVLVH